MSLLLEPNPLREGLPRERVADPVAFVIFGGTGDLAHKKLFPALFSLYCQGLLPSGFAIIALGKRQISRDDFLDGIEKAVEASGALHIGSCAWHDFAGNIQYVSLDYSDLDGYKQLEQALRWADENHGTEGNRIFYLSIPPSGFEEVTINLGKSGLSASDKGWTRIVIEKPFGTDLESAKRLNATLLGVFNEDQIYRIDHYLGKETVQNILVFRFANSIFEPLWNQKYIDHVQITIAETIGVEDRGAFYEQTGALRDVVQNHGLQLLSLVAMEPPVSLAPDDVRNEKLKLLQSVRSIPEESVDSFAARGQYGSGYLLGEPVKGYREEHDVDSNSNTETFVAMQLYVDNWRWSGVPFFIRAGKRLSRRVTEITIQFKEVPEVLFRRLLPEQVEPNSLTIVVQPDEGVTLKTEVKVPGLDVKLRPVQMDFRYGSSFGAPVPEAYERLLLDAAIGDPSLFARSDSVEQCWQIVSPILDFWQNTVPGDFPNYVPGSWGPQSALDLMARAGRKWRKL